MIGDGQNRYQMVGVADVADACLRAAERDATGIFNLGSADPPTVNALLGELIRRAGSGARLLHIPAAPARAALWSLAALGASPLTPEQFRIADVDYTLDTRRAQRELGWSPRHSDVDMLWAAYVSWRDGRAAATGRQTADGARELADLRT